MATILWSWGDDTNGQLGIGGSAGSEVPVEIPELSDVRDIQGGSGHALALLGDGTVWTWGRNCFGQLGNGTNQPSGRPAKVPGLTDVVAVSGGGGHSLALRADGTVWSWGAGFFGALGDDTPFMRPVPAPVAGTAGVVAIAAGGSHSMALTESGEVFSWGRDDVGQLADADIDRPGREIREYKGNRFACRPVAAKVESVFDVRAIAVGGGHTLVLLAGGTVMGWGFNDRGQIGDGTTENRPTPVKVEGLPPVSAFALGYHHSVALGTDGTVWAWGLNDGGQLGDGTTTDRIVPLPARGVTGAVGIAANGGGNDQNPGGGGHTLAVLADGTVLGWGWNDRGQLGDGSTVNRSDPVRVGGLAGVRSVTVGGDVPPPREQPTKGTSWALADAGGGRP